VEFHHSTLGSSLPPNGCVSNGLDHKNLNLYNSLGLTLETENLSSLVLYSTPNVKSQLDFAFYEKLIVFHCIGEEEPQNENLMGLGFRVKFGLIKFEFWIE
jgi:hypothetical protein